MTLYLQFAEYKSLFLRKYLYRVKMKSEKSGIEEHRTAALKEKRKTYPEWQCIIA